MVTSVAFYPPVLYGTDGTHSIAQTMQWTCSDVKFHVINFLTLMEWGLSKHLDKRKALTVMVALNFVTFVWIESIFTFFCCMCRRYGGQVELVRILMCVLSAGLGLTSWSTRFLTFKHVKNNNTISLPLNVVNTTKSFLLKLRVRGTFKFTMFKMYLRVYKLLLQYKKRIFFLHFYN